ncbi:MAG: hypothetical protein LUD72_00930 [Bacteroidales bacterium]|nr:hypothetical protein [Bacteroidales bacterium]
MNKEVKPIAFITQVPRPLSYGGVAYNGYVAIPPSHPLHGADYYEDNRIADFDVHGGITWSAGATREDEAGRREWQGMVKDGEPIEGEMEDIGDDWWVLGFDTMHLGDNAVRWNREAVAKETLRLLEQINKVEEKKNDETTGV